MCANYSGQSNQTTTESQALAYNRSGRKLWRLTLSTASNVSHHRDVGVGSWELSLRNVQSHKETDIEYKELFVWNVCVRHYRRLCILGVCPDCHWA